jgi:hypothetical protein
MELIYRLEISLESDRFILFTEDVHQELIKEGYHRIENQGYIPDRYPVYTNIGEFNGYLLTLDRYENPEDCSDEIFRYKWLEDHPTDPDVIEVYRRLPSIKPIDTTGLTGEDKIKAERQNMGKHGIVSIAPVDVIITEADVNYPIHSERLIEMYPGAGNGRFYVRIQANKGYN